MQNSTKLIASVIIATASVHAATITLNTNSFVADSTNTDIVKNTGVVSVGTYSSLPTFTGVLTNSDVTGSYMELGYGVFDSPLEFDGFFNFDLNVEILNSFNNQDIYLVLGDGSTVQDSDSLLVWKSTENPDGNVFIEDNPIGGPGSIVLDSETGDLILGSFDSDTNRFSMSSVLAIPEPSTFALSGLALFALAGRRSRQ